MRTHLIRLAACALLAAFSGCTGYSYRRLEPFDWASHLPKPEAATEIIVVEPEAVWRMPQSVAFAEISGNFAGVYGNDALTFAEKLRQRAWDRNYRPDWISLHHGAQTTGVSTVINGPITGIAIPSYQGNATGRCWRVLPGWIGVEYTPTLLVTMASPEARAAGLLEGDTLIEIDGATLDTSSPQNMLAMLVNKKPGDVVQVGWVRPGTGRMSGQVALSPTTLAAPKTGVMLALAGPLKADGQRLPSKRWAIPEGFTTAEAKAAAERMARQESPGDAWRRRR